MGPRPAEMVKKVKATPNPNPDFKAITEPACAVRTGRLSRK
jgi:hypothetical protein